jgi:hypothetical protein
MDTTELRLMVTHFAATLARKTIEAVDSTGLSSGYLEEDAEVGGVKWHVTTTYWSDSQTVRIAGHPHRDPEGPALPHPVMGIIMPAGLMQNEDEGEFNFLLPSAWLPATVPTITGGEVA